MITFISTQICFYESLLTPDVQCCGLVIALPCSLDPVSSHDYCTMHSSISSCKCLKQVNALLTVLLALEWTTWLAQLPQMTCFRSSPHNFRRFSQSCAFFHFLLYICRVSPKYQSEITFQNMFLRVKTLSSHVSNYFMLCLITLA